MCGICGFAGKGIIADENLIKEMTSTLVHRGPDEGGIYLNSEIALGARRLSIIDLAKGQQPVSNEDKSIWVAFNGEIYNFKEIREELLKSGHKFLSGSDTEVIVHSYEEYGEEAIEKFRGMFAFALWDNNKKKLLLARDRIGIKPLFYTLLNNGIIVFGSEIKSILKYPGINKEIEIRALDCFLSLEYIIAPLSIFKNIYKLKPGHYLIFQEGKINLYQYWDAIKEVSEKLTLKNIKEIKEELIIKLKEAVRYRLISDVPLGAFLSGGIDSSSVVSMMVQEGINPVKTFSIGFEEASYNELKYARKIADLYSTEHYEQIIKPDAVELVNTLIYYLDEPLGDFSIFPTYLVSKMAREKVKVILSGDGGDELFAGYEHYKAQHLSSIYEKLPNLLKKGFFEFIGKKLPPSAKKKGIINLYKRFIEGFSKSKYLRHFRWCIFLLPTEKEKLYSADFINSLGDFSFYDLLEPHFKKAQHLDEINAELYLDLKTYLVDDILVKVDRMSMATSLEARVPLLDHKFVEWVMLLPGELKLRNFESKWIFKKSLEKYLPKEIIYRRKEGFSIPIKNWLRKELRIMMEETLSEAIIRDAGLFNYDYIDQLKKEHLSNRFDHSHKLWALMIFHLWRKQFIS